MNDFRDVALQIITSLALQIPMLAIWTTGVVLAILRWQKHPRRSLFLLIGFSLLLIVTPTFEIARPILFRWMIIEDASRDTIEGVMIAMACIHILFHGAAWILVLIGAFSAGTSPAHSPQAGGQLSAQQLASLGRVNPMSTGFFVGSIVIAGALSNLLLLVTHILVYIADQPRAGMILPCVTLPLIIYGMVVIGVFLHRLWSAIQAGSPRTTPGKAVGFLFIPFFGFYWVFQAYWGWAKDYNRMIAGSGIDAPTVPEGLALAIPIFIVATLPFGFIPFLGPILAIPGLVLQIVFVVKACGAVNALAQAAGRTPTN